MDKPLSYSGYKRYTTCPRLYKYHDIEKIRPGKETSALIVGTIVDECVMHLLTSTRLACDLHMETKLMEAREKTIEFFLDDLDFDLIDLQTVNDYARKAGWKGDDLKAALKDMMKAQGGLSEKQYDVLRMATWQSLQVKIEAMLASFEKWIMPKLSECEDFQFHVDDGITHGYLDFTAKMPDGKRVLFDLKTSKMPYDKDAVLKSPQLSLYARMHGYDYAGYIVLVKTLNKNKRKSCPECDFIVDGGNRTKCPTHKVTLDVEMNPTSYSQILVDKVPKHNKELTKRAMDDTIKAIDGGHFPRNLNTCYWMYGKPCPYVDTCWRKNE